jgi:hypothetical protein
MGGWVDGQSESFYLRGHRAPIGVKKPPRLPLGSIMDPIPMESSGSR